MVQLHQSHAEDIVPVTISIDEISSPGPVAGILQQVAVSGANVVCTETEAIMEAFGSQSIPMVRVYGRDGEVAKTFTGGASYEDDISPFVKTLLRKENEASE